MQANGTDSHPDPRAVLTPENGSLRGAIPGLYDRAAEQVLAFADEVAVIRGADPLVVAQRGAALLDQFGQDVIRRGGLLSTVPPARLALGLILDQAARSNKALDGAVWSGIAPRYLFDGRDMSLAMLRDLIGKAADGGAQFQPIKGFLETCLARLAGNRRRFDRSTGPNWTGIVVVLVSAFCLAVMGWVVHVERTYHGRLNAVFEREAAAIGLGGRDGGSDLAARLDQLKAVADGVSAEAARVPVHLAAGLFGFHAGQRAQTAYRAAVAQYLPGAIAQAIDGAVATDGGAVPLYDTLRAWAVLSGQADWSPAYLRGWLEDRGDPAEAGLARHAMALAPPFASLPAPDAELMAQALGFAAEAPEAERAFLELRRSDAVAALPDWVADQVVPGLSDVVFRRSGLPMDAPVPGLFTTAGWTYARDIGAGLAVQTARGVASRMFPTPPAAQNDAPDRVMARLQAETLARWQAYLADLRVKPFQDPDAAVRISGELALQDSPLVGLMRAVWDAAGGNDRQRDHEQQLLVAAEFGPMIQYVEQGRMADISALFAGLNVALGAVERDADTGLQRLMTVQDRAQSITALRQAPAVVVQIVEDVLAQTGASHADMLTNPLTRAWQTETLSTCRGAVEGRYPFVPDGADADPATVAQVLGPGGALDRFFRTRAADYLDTTASPWRWKPEARFAGLSPDSAVFFERAERVSAGLLGPNGAGTDLTLAALAERGQAVIMIGGQGGPVTTTTDVLRLNWPGPSPDKGADVSFTTPSGAAKLAGIGPWGLLRLLEPFRLRDRDNGKRFVIDLHADAARLFVEVTFDTAQNPLAIRALLKGLQCPPVL